MLDLIDATLLMALPFPAFVLLAIYSTKWEGGLALVAWTIIWTHYLLLLSFVAWSYVKIANVQACKWMMRLLVFAACMSFLLTVVAATLGFLGASPSILLQIQWNDLKELSWTNVCLPFSFFDKNLLVQLLIPARLDLNLPETYDNWSEKQYAGPKVALTWISFAICVCLGHCERRFMKRNIESVRGWVGEFWAGFALQTLWSSVFLISWASEVDAPDDVLNHWALIFIIAFMLPEALLYYVLWRRMLVRVEFWDIVENEAVEKAEEVLAESEFTGCGSNCPNVQKARSIISAYSVMAPLSEDPHDKHAHHRYTYNSSFRGAGGDACGAQTAGVTIIGSFDKDPVKDALFKLNFPSTLRKN